MSNPRKKLKTDYGSIATTHDETLEKEDSALSYSSFIASSSNDAGSADESNRNKRRLVIPTANDATWSIFEASWSISNTSILDLNDDCLEEIFERASITDFWSIAQTCKRLKKIMIQIFGRKYKSFKVNSNAIVSAETAVDTRRLFQTFGSFIVDLEIDFSETVSMSSLRTSPNSANIIRAVIQFCTAVKALKHHAVYIPDSRYTFIGMKKLFEKLNKLHMKHVFIKSDDVWTEDMIFSPNGNLMNFFSNCPSLVELEVVGSYFFYRDIYENTFPKLDHFSIQNQFSIINYSTKGFILRHPNLKTISFKSTEDHTPNLKVLATNGDSIQKLGFGLSFRSHSHQPLETLAKFRNLKELKCFFVGHNMPNIVNELPKLKNSLEVLELSYGKYTAGLIPVVSMLRKLQVFRLFDIIAFDNDIIDLHPLAELIDLTELSLRCNGRNFKFDLVKIVNRLANLTTLTFHVADYKIREADYLQLLNIVGSRPTKNRSLVIDCPTADDFQYLLRAAVKFK